MPERPLWRQASQSEEGRETFPFLDTVNAKLDVDEAVEDNPEKRGVATAILAACYLVFGAERVDIKELGQDVLLPRLNGFLIAYNDQVDIAEKIKDSDPDVYAMIIEHVQVYKSNLEGYFQPTGDAQEDARRQEFKQFYDRVFAEVDVVEHELFTIKTAGDPLTLDAERFRIQQGRELVNAIEMLMNIRICIPGIFSGRAVDQNTPKTIEALAKKYAWIIDPEYKNEDLSDDEKRARLLFFSTMSNQCALDELDYKEDSWFDIWKKMTYMTEVQKVPIKEANKIMQQDAKRYARLAQQYGMSGAAITAANELARAICHVKNKAYGCNWLRSKVADKAEKKGHIRERAINVLRAKHPEKYQI